MFQKIPNAFLGAKLPNPAIASPLSEPLVLRSRVGRVRSRYAHRGSDDFPPNQNPLELQIFLLVLDLERKLGTRHSTRNSKHLRAAPAGVAHIIRQF